MVQWMSIPEITRDTLIYGKFALVLAGIAAWDVGSTLPFDFSIITGKRKWRWPMAIYFICRICLLLHIFAIAVNLNALGEIPCQQVVWISKVADAIGTPCASLILLLRTSAVWRQDKKVWIPLTLVWIGQVVLWVQTFRFSTSVWNAQRNQCQVVKTAPQPLLVAVFSYTMAFDLIILVLCTWRLQVSRARSNLSNLLFRDGIVYFIAAFGANLLQMIFAALQLNPVMNIFFLPFALVVSVIASTTIFRNLFTLYDDFSNQNSSGPTASGGSAQVTAGPNRTAASRVRGLSTSKRGPGVITETFALGQVSHNYQSQGGIEVTRVVDIERDADSTVHLPYGESTATYVDTSKRSDFDEDGSDHDNWAQHDEKKSRLPL